jgi:hypothetical protein
VCRLRRRPLVCLRGQQKRAGARRWWHLRRHSPAQLRCLAPGVP